MKSLIKLLTLIVGGLLISGCATTKPKLSFNDKGLFYINEQCSFSYKNQFFSNKLNDQIAQILKYNVMIDGENVSFIESTFNRKFNPVQIEDMIKKRYEVIEKTKSKGIELVEGNALSSKNKNFKLHGFFLMAHSFQGFKIIRFENRLLYNKIKTCLNSNVNLKPLEEKKHQDTGRSSFDSNGFHKRDKYHIDTMSLHNEKGFSITGIHEDTETQYNEEGFDINGVNKDSNKR